MAVFTLWWLSCSSPQRLGASKLSYSGPGPSVPQAVRCWVVVLGKKQSLGNSRFCTSKSPMAALYLEEQQKRKAGFG